MKKNHHCIQCGSDAFAIVKDALEHAGPSKETLRRFDSMANMAKLITTILVTVILAGVGAQWKIIERTNGSTEAILIEKIDTINNRISKHEEDLESLKLKMAQIYPLIIQNSER